MEQEQELMDSKKERKKNRVAAFLIVIIAVAATAIGAYFCYNIFFDNTKEKQPEMEFVPETDFWTAEESPLPELPEADYTDIIPEEPEPDRELSSIPAGEEIYSQEPVPLTDISVFEGETASFQCYDKDAMDYEWEYYSTLDRQWQGIERKPELEKSTGMDSLHREVSLLEVPGTKENNLLGLRCTAKLADGSETRWEASLNIMEAMENIEGIHAEPLQAEAGGYLSALTVPIVIDMAEGEQTVSGLYGLSFCVSQNEEESKVYDQENSVMTEVYTKTSRESAYVCIEEGEQTVPVRFRYKDEIYDTEIQITGTDTRAPEISGLRLEYEVSNQDVKNTPVKIYAEVTDNYCLPSEITYAFAAKGQSGELQWQEQLPLETEVPKNGTYCFYAKDKAGNVSQKETEIIAVDTKAPVIHAISLGSEAGGAESNTITVDASDKTELSYRFLSDSGSVLSEWGNENTYTATINGTYTIEVKDAAGNTTEGTITISNLDTAAPRIVSIHEKDMVSENNGISIDVIPGSTDMAGISFPMTDTGNAASNPPGAVPDITTSPVQGSETAGILPSPETSMTGTATAAPPVYTPAPRQNTYSTSGTSYGTMGTASGIKGAKGDKGETGRAGTSAFVHIRYSEDSKGSSMSTVPGENTRYIGIYSGPSQTAPTTASSYTWSLYQGENTHVHMKFSASPDGSGMTDQPGADTRYIGFCTTSDKTAPVLASDYTWSKFVEEAANVYIRYSAYENGAGMTQTPTAESSYIGLCTTTAASAPTDPASYSWSQYKGTSSYVHIRFSAQADGSGMTEAVSQDSRYMGICNTASPSAPSSPSDYSWIRITGESGSSSYIHVKYSQDGNGTDMTDTPNENTCYMGIYADSESQPSSDPSAYKWCRISYGSEVNEMKTEIALLQSQIQVMQGKIDELENR
ncbi:hypothetical protein IMSAG249_00279 [Lachnospiraceae bacterium]|nr:hypothetical protein IMSAG249_00279 [Lachnospiraceae bacterium]